MHQPDQDPSLWNNHVSVYEAVFEPFTQVFAQAAIARLGLAPGASVLDSGAGAGGAALALARCGMQVTAIDAAAGMVERIGARCRAEGLAIDARVMDGEALALPEASFDAAISVFGVVLYPDAERGLAELVRVVRPGGRIGVVTWTEPERYELAARLRAAALAVYPELPPAPLPAQLRYRVEVDFRALFARAGCRDVVIERVQAVLRAASPHWLGEQLAFAPGMRAMLDALGDRQTAAVQRFVAGLEADYGRGPVALGGVAFLATTHRA